MHFNIGITRHVPISFQMTTSKNDVRLPKNVIPKKYTLHYDKIDLHRFYFTGDVKIDLIVKEATSTVSLHANELLIKSVKITQDGHTQEATSILLKIAEQQAQFTFPKSLTVGDAVLQIVFQGELNDKLCGFYRSKYTVEGKQRYHAVTQFEATDARRALPCWDEPALKATFECSLATPIDRVAVSNTPVVETRVQKNADGVDERIWKFAETPIMSTYLLAFVVGEFDTVSGYTKEGVQMTVYTPVGKSEQGKFALKVGTECLSYFSRFFGIPYPLAKCDMLAIPDFSAGAMENWGCVTYREAALLIDEKQSSNAMRVRVATVVCHELAHQWFGNLVTMEWWTGLWLNEGFATFMQYVATDHIFPSWNIWRDFVATMYQEALNLDALTTSHPIEVEVNHPDEVNEIFDAISYNKGASVIRMLSDHIGLDAFMAGVQIYLKRHSYSNAVTEDLWNAIGEASKTDINGLMKAWTKQMGYPVIIVGDNGEVKQHRFLASGVLPLKDEEKWIVPLTYLDGKTRVRKTLENLTSLHRIDNELKSGGFKLNASSSSVYRVQYTSKQYEALSPFIGLFDDTDRIGLLSDSFALSAAGSLPTSEALNLVLSAFTKDDSYNVWELLSGKLSSLGSLYRDHDFLASYRRFVNQVAKPTADKLGWGCLPTDSNNTMLFRATVLRLLGLVGEDSSTIEQALKLFEAFIQDPNAEPSPLHPDLRQLCFGIAIGQDDHSKASKAYDQILSLYETSSLSEEKRRCLLALGRSKNEATLIKTLNLSLSDRVRSQDVYLVIASVTSNFLGRDIAWKWFKENKDTIRSRFQQGGLSTLGYVISSVLSGFASDSSAKEIEEFFQTNPFPSANRKIAQSLETIRNNAKRLERDEKVVREFLKSKKF